MGATSFRWILQLHKDVPKAARFYKEGLDFSINVCTLRWAELESDPLKLALMHSSRIGIWRNINHQMITFGFIGPESCFSSYTSSSSKTYSRLHSSSGYGVFIQVLCSYNTLPLYALVTQMGSYFKKSIFVEHIQAKVVGWANLAEKKTAAHNNGTNGSGHDGSSGASASTTAAVAGTNGSGHDGSSGAGASATAAARSALFGSWDL